MINVGIVGLGFMAVAHLKAYAQIPHARISTLCNPSGRHLDGDFSSVAGNVGDQSPLKLQPTSFKACRDYNELLADPEIQLIDICAPTLAHPELAIAALKAGKHVICEKPLARTSALARQIVEATHQAQTFFMPAMCLRFWPEWRWLKLTIEEQRYGKVLAVRFRRVAQPPGWGHGHFHDGAKSGGALLDLHIHDVDFVQHCFGKPRAVYATGYQKFSGAIDHVVAQYHVASGAMVHAEGAWAMSPGFGFNASYTANFEHATADFDSSRGAEALKLYVEGQPPQIVKADATEGTDGYVGELRHFIEAIQTGKAPTRVTAAEGLSAIELCEAEEKSIRTGGIIQL